MFEFKDIVLLIFGAAIGFGIDRIKSLLDLRKARRQLFEELQLNLRMLPSFRDYLDRAIDGLKNYHAPNMRALHFSRAAYDANYSSVLPLLTQAERSSYHIIYEHLSLCNEISDAAARILLETGSKEEFSRQSRIYSQIYQSLLVTVGKTKEHIEEHLQGRPRDAFLEDIQT
jgi:hypothetical protein